MLATAVEVKAKFMSDVLLWTPTHGHTSIGRPTRLTYISSVQILDAVKET